jgi:hypothetical protein
MYNYGSKKIMVETYILKNNVKYVFLVENFYFGRRAHFGGKIETAKPAHR